VPGNRNAGSGRLRYFGGAGTLVLGVSGRWVREFQGGRLNGISGSGDRALIGMNAH
jgi:hypothetical protein